jgi:hypothetical protein
MTLGPRSKAFVANSSGLEDQSCEAKLWGTSSAEWFPPLCHPNVDELVPSGKMNGSEFAERDESNMWASTISESSS